MKSDTRRERMAKLMAEGEDDELLKLIEKEPEISQEELNEIQTDSREAEALLAFLRDPTMFINRECKTCYGVFITDYGCVAYCSDFCRAKALQDMGIDWDFTRPLHQRWGNRSPLIVPPKVLQILQKSLAMTPQMGLDNSQQQPISVP